MQNPKLKKKTNAETETQESNRCMMLMHISDSLRENSWDIKFSMPALPLEAKFQESLKYLLLLSARPEHQSLSSPAMFSILSDITRL